MGKTLVVYYSAQGNTKDLAEKIAKNLEADLFEIKPAQEYTNEDLDWTDDESRVCREHDDESLRDVELETAEVPNWSEYDKVLIGYPIWWGIAAWPTNSFVHKQDFEGKTVVPFCCSHTSGLGNSDKLLGEGANGDWKPGIRFPMGASDEDIKNWTDSL